MHNASFVAKLILCQAKRALAGRGACASNHRPPNQSNRLHVTRIASSAIVAKKRSGETKEKFFCKWLQRESAQRLEPSGIRLRNGLSPAEEFSELTHELAHELLHKSDRRKETSKTVRETETEAVAFVVCQAIGLKTGTAAADYIRLYNGDADTLGESLDFIQKPAPEIIAAITSEQYGGDEQ